MPFPKAPNQIDKEAGLLIADIGPDQAGVHHISPDTKIFETIIQGFGKQYVAELGCL